jgi:hypothetical protein
MIHLELAEPKYWLSVARIVLSEFGAYILGEPGILMFILIMSVSGMIQTYYSDYMWD